VFCIFFLANASHVDSLASCLPRTDDKGVVLWKNSRKLHNCIHLIAIQVRENRFDELFNSDYLTFLWDCSTSRAVKEHGVLSIRHMDNTNSRSVETFVCLVAVSDVTANGEANLLRFYIGQILKHSKG